MATEKDIKILLQSEEIVEIEEIISNVMVQTYGFTTRSRRDSFLILEFLYDLRNEGKVSRYFVGSRSEGTAHSESDIDKLIIWKKIMVCQGDEEVNEKSGVVFLMDRANCQPGYTKLKLVKNEKKEKTVLDHYEKNIDDIVEKSEMEGMDSYLSNEKVVQFFLDFLDKKKVPSLNYYRNGPCATGEFESYHFLAHNFRSDMDCDFAQGFEICGITEEGERWLKGMVNPERKLNGLWPPIEICQKMRALKCHVVAVGGHDRNIPDYRLKWRISYTLWERELIWSFEDVQLYCLIILKLLQQKKLKHISDDISSFHMKNIVFLESMEWPLEKLQTSCLLFLLHKCLVRLLEAIKKQRLDHFIDRSRNLFEAKLTDDDARRKLIDYLDEELIKSTNVVPVILECIGKDDMKEIWNSCQSKPAEFLREINVNEVCGSAEDNQKLRKYKEIFFYGFDALNIKMDVLTVFNKDTFCYTEHFEDMGKLDVDAKWVDTVKDIVISRNALHLGGNPEEFGITDLIIKNDLEHYTDALSGRLYLCTYLIRNGRYSEAEDTIEAFLKSGPKLLLYCGFGSEYNGIHVEMGQAKHTTVQESSLGVPKESFPFVHDVIFDKVDINILLPVIQIQSFLEKTHFINPIMYMYYIKVVCDVNLKKSPWNSLKRLKDTYCQCKLREGNFRHLNLLGHAYFLTNTYEDAYKCFYDSIRETRHNEAPNSVFYLLLVLIYQIFSKPANISTGAEINYRIIDI